MIEKTDVIAGLDLQAEHSRERAERILILYVYCIKVICQILFFFNSSVTWTSVTVLLQHWDLLWKINISLNGCE